MQQNLTLKTNKRQPQCAFSLNSCHILEKKKIFVYFPGFLQLPNNCATFYEAATTLKNLILLPAIYFILPSFMIIHLTHLKRCTKHSIATENAAKSS